MKIKYILALFLIGVLLVAFGAWMKILHLQFATIVFTSGIFIKGLAIIFGIIKLFTSDKFKDFLNS